MINHDWLASAVQLATFPTRFQKKVYVNGDGCWLWRGSLSRQGYGQYGYERKVWLAHRYSYSVSYGWLDASEVIDHKCFKRECVNPKHLRIVNKKQNAEHREGANGNSSSGYRGVHWNKQRRKYFATVCSAGHSYHGGAFDSAEDANLAAIDLRRKHFTHDDGKSHG